MRWCRTCRRKRPITSPSPAISSTSRSRPNLRRRGPGWRASAPPDRVTVIPGNHDAYVRATQHRFAEAWGKLSRRRRRARRRSHVSVAAPARPAGADQRVVGGADAAADGDGMARTHPARRARARCWRGFPPSEAFRVLLIHHPLRSNSRVKRLTDSAELLALLKRHGVELVLHGHDHVHSTIWVEGPNGTHPRRSACRRRRRSRMAIIRPPPTICFRSSATATRGGSSRRCAASTTTLRVRQLRQTRLI